MEIQNIDEQKEISFLIDEAQKDFLFYVQANDEKYIASKVHRFLAGKLMDIYEGKIKRLIINIPPQIGKSRMVSQEFPTWVLGNDPTRKIALTGYGQHFVNEHALAARTRMQSEMYQTIFKTRLRGKKVETWSTTQGGGFKAVGIGGPLTGRGADLLIVDDPVKSFEESISPTYQEKTWNWFWSVAMSRLSEDAAVIIIMTRWNVGDLVGRLTDPKEMAKMDDEIFRKEDKWEIINLPALAKENDPLGRLLEESIFPEKKSADFFRRVKATSIPYIWASLYEGDPQILGGNYIPIEKFVIDEKAPEGLRWARGWDLATDSKKANNPFAGIAGALDGNGDLWLRDCHCWRENWPNAREKMKMIATVEKIPLGIEAVGGFKTAYQNFVEVMPPDSLCVEIGVDKDKLTRAQGWIALVAKGKVHLIRGPWIPEYLVQAGRFTGKDGEEDDQMDATSIVYQLVKNGLNTPMPFKTPDKFSRARAERRNREIEG